MREEQANHPAFDRPADRWRMFVVLALLLVLALMETSVSILFPTVSVGGRVAYAATEVVWRTLVPGVLTLAAAALGMWFEARRLRWHSRLCLAACAVTGFLVIIPTIVSVVGLLVTSRSHAGKGLG